MDTMSELYRKVQDLERRLERLGAESANVTSLTFGEQTATPTDPADGAEVRVYMKADKLVLQYNDGGTVRYKYLDLTGTGATWTHDTTPP